MPRRVKNIELDINNDDFTNKFSAKQYEDLEINIYLQDDLNLVSYADCEVSFGCDKDVNATCSIIGRVATVLINNEDLVDTGKYNAELVIQNEDGTLLTPTFSFFINESVDVFNALGETYPLEDCEGYNVRDPKGFLVNVKTKEKILRHSAEEIDQTIEKVKKWRPPTTGKSAYEIWLEQGNKGTELDFLNSLKAQPPNLVFRTDTLPPGSSATVSTTGTYPNLIITIGIPRGETCSEPSPETAEKMYYGRLSIAEVGGLIIPYSSLKANTILKGYDITTSSVRNLNRVSLGAESDTETGDYSIVLVPKNLDLTVTKDDGFGSKVPFNEEVQGANGIDILVNNEPYLLYGEILTTPSEIFIYVE